MNKPKINIQDQLLFQARKEKSPLRIYLIRGLMLTGRVISYDAFSILIESQGKLQLLFKHGISTIDFPPGFRPKGEQDEDSTPSEE